jgi:tetratricopeptide (TPR) repeat protein
MLNHILENVMRKALLIFVLVTFSGNLSAQEVPPALMIKAPGETKSKPLYLSKVDVQARIFGFIAETKMTMTFKNDYDRVLEGNLYFPLPEGSTVSGYALDIGGKMVDGVVVTKEKARVVFEKEVRRQIDPGILEWVKGNNFKTRIYPIPARGSRTVAVRYVSDLDFDQKGQASYRLPLKFEQPLDSFSMRVEVLKTARQPTLAWQGPGPVKFQSRREGYFAETGFKKKKLTGQMVVTVPGADRQRVMVEKSPDGQVHFCINDFPQVVAKKAAKNPPKHITLLWDASGSREKSDHQREIQLLRAYFSRWKTAGIAVDLVIFRNQAEKPKRFFVVKGNPDKLIDALLKVVYDGGTQMGSISPKKGAQRPDFYFLFSDGLSNIGLENPTGFKMPVYVFGADPGANHPFLRYLAQKTSGEYFNLNRVDDQTAIAGIGTPPFAFLSAKVASGRATELYPAESQPTHGRFTLTGKLEGKQATVVLSYGVAGLTLQRVKYDVSAKNAVRGDLLARFWAQKKLYEIVAFPRRNRQAMLELGKRYGLVTPGTSLIVLERLDQYVEHEIPPPRSLPEMRNQYLRIMDERMVMQKKEEKSKLDHVLSLWKTRVEWWKTKFKYPKNFRYPGKEEKKSRRIEATGAAPDAEMVAEPRPAPVVLKPPDESATPMKKGKKLALKDSRSEPGTIPNLALKPWDPKEPYLTTLKQAPAGRRFDEYLKQKKEYGGSPAFYLDCSDFFIGQKNQKLGMQVLSNVSEMELENAALLRILAHRLAQHKELKLAAGLFEEVLRLRPEEPQSYRDLALVLSDLKKYPRAMELLAHVVMNRWDRFNEIEVIALMELNRIIALAQRAGIGKFPVDRRLIMNLNVDVRIILTWDADLTDIDLWIIEPSGEKAYYSHPRSTIGGNVSRDFTQGYGPEEYILKKAMRGMYKVQANFYGSSAQTLSGAVTLQLDLYTNYGRRNEKKKSITLRLKERKDTITVGVLEF